MILINKIKQWFCGWWYGHVGNWKWNDRWKNEVLPDGTIVNTWDCPRCGYTHKIIYKNGEKIFEDKW